MLNLLQTAPARHRTLLAVFRHLGALGLFALAILDSSPLPTFGGPDILLIILVASKRHPWFEFAGAAVAGSLIGACITFTVSRKAGTGYLHRHFGQRRLGRLFEIFKQRGGPLLATSTAVPFPFPTSAVFAAAGASGYPAVRFLLTVSACRAVRYSLIAILADRYGRTFARVLRHPVQHWPWLLAFLAVAAALVWAMFLLNRRLSRHLETQETRA